METEKVVTEDIMASSAEEVPVAAQETPMPAEPPVEPLCRLWSLRHHRMRSPGNLSCARAQAGQIFS